MRLFVLFIAILPISSCGLLDGIVATETPVGPSRSQIAQDSIMAWVQRDLNQGKDYRSFAFGDLVAYKPASILRLDSLYDLKLSRTSDLSRSELDTLIAQQKREIVANGDHTLYSMRHIFMLSEQDERYPLAEYDVFMDHQFNVERIEVVYEATPTSDGIQSFSNYFNGYPIYYAYEEEVEVRSLEIYDTMEEGLYLGQTSTERSSFLQHMLFVLTTFRENKSLDLEFLLAEIGKNALSENTSAFPSYQPLLWSDAKSIYLDQSSQDDLKGYAIFHKFRVAEGVKDVEKGCYMEFDKYFRLTRVDLLDPPYEKYF